MKVHLINCQIDPQYVALLSQINAEHLWVNERAGCYQTVLKSNYGYWLLNGQDLDYLLNVVREYAAQPKGYAKSPRQWHFIMRENSASVVAAIAYFDNPIRYRLLKFKRAG